MRLISIKLAGFKSFVDPTTVPFPQSITAIVGPNGCGKSNIIDAVRWVLGEGSAKNLRGDSMTDVIFNGSLERKPVSLASVELNFDNSTGRVGGAFAQFDQLSIKRQLHRDGQNLYFINGTKCRRRDITDIFLGTGLGPRSYAIIEQGTISRLIESKPQELRIFIEEAAGISKYKERRRETEIRIRHSRDHLARLNDLRSELAQQLDKLQKQAAAARRYTELKGQERRYKAELSAFRWRHWQQQADALSTQIQRLQLQWDALDTQRQKRQSQQIEQDVLLQAASLSWQNSKQNLFQIEQEITRLEQQILHHQQQQLRVHQEQTRLQQERAELLAYVQAQQHSLERIKQHQIERAEQEAEAQLISLQLSEQVNQQELAYQQHQSHCQHLSQHWIEIKQQVQRTLEQTQLFSQQKSSLHAQLQRMQTREIQLNQQDWSLLSATLEQECRALSLRLLEQEQQTQAAEDHWRQLHQHQQNAQQVLQTHQHQATSLQGQRQALQHWLQQIPAEVGHGLGEQPVQAMSECLHIESGWENAVEFVLGSLSHAWLVASLPHEWADLPQGCSLALSPQLAPDAKPGRLAAVVTGYCGFHSVLNQIHLAHSAEEFWQIQSQLLPSESVICKEGIWAGQHWLRSVEQAQGQLAICAEMKRLEEALHKLGQQIAKDEINVTQSEQALSQGAEHLKQVQRQEVEMRTQLQTGFTELRLRQERMADQRQQQTALSQERADIDAEMEQLQQQIAQAETHHSQLEIEYAKSDKLYQSAQQHSLALQSDLLLATQRRDLQHQQAQNLTLERASLLQQQNAIEQALERAALQQHQLDQRTIELGQLPQGDQELGLLQSRINKQKDLRQEALQCQINLEEKVQVGQQAHRLLKQQAQELDEEQRQLKSKQDQCALELQSVRVRAESVLEGISDTGHTLERLLEQLPNHCTESAWQNEIARVSSEIARMGAINLAAIEDYQQAFDRKSYLDSQTDDLNQALETLESAIRRIDKECRVRFKETFDKVNDDLKVLFPKVFGGGSAYLQLTEQDLLETGVSIMARPPGKRNATIHLLSGGEKALTALSLVFAIFRLNPAPFCLLDEVDAPLDDANVSRFCNLVREMAETVQFIYISHNKVTMAMAEQLSGVTMHEPGVSRIVSVDVDEAVALAQVS